MVIVFGRQMFLFCLPIKLRLFLFSREILALANFQNEVYSKKHRIFYQFLKFLHFSLCNSYPFSILGMIQSPCSYVIHRFSIYSHLCCFQKKYLYKKISSPDAKKDLFSNPFIQTLSILYL